MSRSLHLTPADRQSQDVRVRIQQQRARLQRMIVQGTIAQSDDDLLHEMYVTLKELRARRLDDTRT
jgi:hypothetical protein